MLNRNCQSSQDDPIIIPKLCLVCGDRASAFNFGGLSCGSCKIFFRRNAKSYSKNSKCFNQCQITVANRRMSCRKCRLEKCFSIGMKKQLIHSRVTNNEEEQLFNSEIYRDERTFYQNELNNHELEQLSEIQNAMSIFTNEKEQQLVGIVNNCSEVFNLRGLYIKKIIKFCKALSPFKALNERDQLVILKQFHPEITGIRAAFLYDSEKDGFNQIVNESGDKVVFIPTNAYHNETVSGLSRFFRNFIRYCHEILGDDCALLHQIFIRNQHLVYGRLIRRYIQHKYHKSDTTDNELELKYAVIMLMLQEFDYLRCSIKNILGEMDRQKVDLLMAEIYNL